MTGPAALLALSLLASNATAAPPTLDGSWQQGELIRGQTVPGATVALDGKPLRVGADGRFVFGLDRDAAASSQLEVTTPDGQRQAQRHAVAKRQYAIQRIDGLPPGKVDAPPEFKARIEHEGQLTREARLTDSAGEDWLPRFAWPCSGRISGVYGSQRILNGVSKQPHYGVDVAVPTGTPVHAPAGGVVTLAEPDLYYTGGTLMIDHGHGVTSAFLHLSQLQARVGDRVEAGDVVALSGASGRATGPHLDWRVSWFDARVDPQRLVPPMPGAAPVAPKKASKKTR